MKQEGDAHHGDQQQFLGQFLPEVAHRATDQAGAVVHGDDLDTLKAGWAAARPGAPFYPVYGALGVLAKTHDPIPPRSSPSPLSSAMPRRICGPSAISARPEQQRRAVTVDPERDGARSSTLCR